MATLAQKLPYTHAFSGGAQWGGHQRLPSDPDALDYLSRLAAVEGAVEVGIAMAVENFIKGCKADGIWDAIKASCLLCGARTLAGALVPLRDYGPELVDINSLGSPSINNFGGSAGYWDAASRTAYSTATGAAGYPYFLFPVSVVVGKTYRFSGVLSGDFADLNLFRFGNLNVTIAEDGSFDASLVANFADFKIYFETSPQAVTIESLSIREVIAAPSNVNNNFIEADYNRETGLKGNGSTKYLDSGRAGDDDPLEDHHMACYATETSLVVTHTKMGAVDSATGAYELVRSADRAYFYSRSPTSFFTGTGVGNQTGLYGLSRTGSTLNSRAVGVDYTATRDAVARAGVNIFVFGYNDGSSLIEPTSARLAFYSIGSAIDDLALLDARVTALVQRIQLSLSTGLDASGYDDATVAYLHAAYNNGATLA